MEKSSILNLRSLEPFAQQSRYGISNNALSALLVPSSELQQHFANLTPFLDLALTQPARKLWLKLTQVAQSGALNDGLTAEEVRHIRGYLDDLIHSVNTLSPVLCPRLKAQIDDALLRLTDGMTQISAWLAMYLDVHQECVKQAVPGLPFQWQVRMAASPSYFTQPATEFAPFRSIQLRRADGQNCDIVLNEPGELLTVEDLLRVVAARVDEVPHPLLSPQSIYRLRVADDAPSCLIVFIR